MQPWFLLPCLAALPPVPASHLAGTYVLESGPDLPALIAAATASLKPAERARARDRLEQNNPIHPAFTLGVDDRRITLAWERHPPMRMPIGGLAVPWTGPDGRKDLVSARMEGRDLVQTLLGEDGMRRCVFHLEGGRLEVRVTVKAMRLPAPLTYVLTYRRR